MCVCAVRVYVSVCLCARASRSVHVRVWVYGYVLFTASYSLLLSSPKLEHLKRVSLADVALDTDVVRRSGPRFCSVCLAFSTEHASHPTRVPNARAQVKVRGRERGRSISSSRASASSPPAPACLSLSHTPALVFPVQRTHDSKRHAVGRRSLHHPRWRQLAIACRFFMRQGSRHARAGGALVEAV